MSKREFDVIVIGSGPGGYVASVRAAQLGLKVACIEKDKTLGGTCLNVGCIPSKTLLHASEEYEYLSNGVNQIGVQAEKVSYDFVKMMQNKSSVVKSLTEGIAGLFKGNKVERIEGHARFVDPHTIQVSVDDKTRHIEADNFIIATGSEPVELPFMKFDGSSIISSTGALSLPKVPKKMVVIGGGVIGVELASVYRRLGTEVHIIEMLSEICVAMDPTIRKNLLRILDKQGIVFHLGCAVKSAKKTDAGVSVEFEENKEVKNLDADVVLVAVGRRPYTTSLGLDEIKITKNKNGSIPVDGHFRTNIPHIYAIGDIIDGPMLAHKASDEGAAVAEIIAGKTASVNYMAIPNVIYTHPEAAAVGLTEPEAIELGLEVKTGTAFFKANARARCIGNTEGLVKVISDKKTGRLIGLHIIGPQASEMIGEGVIAIDKKATVADIASASHAHPTLSETIKDAALAAL